MTTSPATLTVAEHVVYLRRAMTRNGITVDSLAKSLRVHPREVTRWRSRTAPTLPDVTMLNALHAILPGYDDPRPEISLDPEYTLDEVAEALGCCERTVRNRMKRKEEAGVAVEHMRRGNRITFTKAQFEAFRDLDRVVPIATPVTTGRGKARS